MRRLLIAILVASLLIPAASAIYEYGPVCIDDTGCSTGAAEAASCPGTYYPLEGRTNAQQAEIDASCGGCCFFGNTPQEGLDAVQCVGQGGTYSPTCEQTNPVNLCSGDGDTDCVCSGVAITAPQVCCQGSVADDTCGGTTPTDPGPQTPPSATCGDGTLQAGEQCEPGSPDIFNSSLCPTSGNSCDQACACAITYDDYDPTDDYCSPTESCWTGGTCNTDLPPPIITTIDSVAQTPNATVSWDLQSTACADELLSIGVTIRAEDGSGVQFEAGVDDREQLFGVDHKKTYNVTVTLYYANGQASDSQLFTSGDERCFAGVTDFCSQDNTQVLHCNEYNEVEEEACSNPTQITGERCYPTLEGAACAPYVDCDLCDASYDSYAEVYAEDASVPVSIGAVTSLQCDSLQQRINIPGTGESYVFCYYGNTRSAAQEYESCAEVRGCIDYLSREACTDDPCQKQGSCEWNDAYDVCVADDPDAHVCDGQPQDICQAQEGCVYYAGTCLDGDVASCVHYGDDAEACEGGMPYVLDPNSNEVIQESNDTFGFGKCRMWSGSCYKDADLDADLPNGELEIDAYFKTPTTNILTPLTEPFGSEPRIGYLRSEEGTTYAEIVQGACEDYNGNVGAPNGHWANRPLLQHQNGVMEFSLTDISGQACLRYYSQDYNQNLEPVQQQDIIIDPTQLEMTIDYVTTTDAAAGKSRVAMDITLTRNASCEARMTEIDLDGGPGTVHEPRLDASSWGDAFDPIYGNLPDGLYRFEITCTSATGSTASEDIGIPLDGDDRLSLPVPRSPPTYSPEQISQVTIHTNETASCTWSRGSQSGDLTAGTLADGLQPHTIPFTTEESGFYVFDFQCSFASLGLTVNAGPADRAAFAVDATAPNITVTLDGEPVEPSSHNIVVDADGSDLDITCTDVPQLRGGTDWASGCVQLHLTLNGEAMPGAGTQRTLNVGPGDALTISGIDERGNTAEAFTLTAVEADISGPELISWEVIP